MTGRHLQSITAPKTGWRAITTGRYLEHGMRFLLAFLLSIGRIFGTFSPFGAAFGIASPTGVWGAGAVLGAMAGYFLSGDLGWALKYISVMLLSRAIRHTMRGTAVAEMSIFPPVVGFLSMAGIGFVYAAETGWAAIPTVTFIAETFISGGCVFFFTVALAPWRDDADGTYGRLSHYVSLTVLLAALLIGLSRLEVFGVLNIGRVVAAAVTLVCAFKGGVGVGCAVGAAVGAAMDLSSGSAPLYTASYALGALFSGIFSQNGRLPPALCFVSVNAIVVCWTWNTFGALGALYDVFAASVIFTALPDSFFTRVSGIFPARRSGSGFLRAREYTMGRVKLLSEAFLSLHEAAGAVAGKGINVDDPSVIFDRACEEVCRTCPGSKACWQKDYTDTVDVLNNVTEKLLHRGRLAEGDLPDRFKDACQRFPRLVAAINAEARAFILRRSYRLRLREGSVAAVSRYADTSRLLSSLSDELGSDVRVETGLERRLIKYLRGLDMDASAAVFRMPGGRLRVEIRSRDADVLKKDPQWLKKLSNLMGTELSSADDREGKLTLLAREPFTVEAASLGSGKDGKGVSGDGVCVFETDEGLFCAVLADGMGTGSQAAEISRQVLGSLERFLKAGTAPDVALSLVSDLIYLENGEDTKTAAMDLLTLDLFTGEAKLHKCGSAPTYLKRNDVIRRVTGRAFPLGLVRPGRDKPFCARVRLGDGCFAVLISDGVTPGGEDRWLREVIKGYGGDNPQELTRLISDGIADTSGREDDRTVLVLHIGRRE